jgi:hypothetical protein
VQSTTADNAVKIGVMEIVFALRPALTALPKGSAVRIFLSNDRLRTATNEDIAALFREMIAANDLHFQMVVCVSGDTQAMSRLLDAYIEALISGHVRLCIVHGLTQTITSAMHILVSDDLCFLINETIGASAPPIAAVIRNKAFAAEATGNFEAAARYAQPVLKIYGDEFTRDVIEILALEYCTPGALDVVKDSINPMFMTTEAYDRFLKTRGHSKDEFSWRSAEFARFKAGMDANLKKWCALSRNHLPLPPERHCAAWALPYGRAVLRGARLYRLGRAGLRRCAKRLHRLSHKRAELQPANLRRSDCASWQQLLAYQEKRTCFNQQLAGL